jgi:hypothetical protein
VLDDRAKSVETDETIDGPVEVGFVATGAMGRDANSDAWVLAQRKARTAPTARIIFAAPNKTESNHKNPGMANAVENEGSVGPSSRCRDRQQLGTKES